MSALVIGLTGGIASGKSTVDRLFRDRGIAVADADAAARDAVAPGSEGLAEVVAAFGTGVLAPDRSLDRAAMRRRVFEDPEARRVLEATCAKADGPYAIASIPLLAEAGGRAAYPWLRRILVVDVPATVQLQRLLRRDGIDTALAEAMIAAQATRAQRLAIADDLLPNDGPLEALPAAMESLDRLYRNLAAA